jgi:hypothetical protein
MADRILKEPAEIATRIAAGEALRGQLHNLEETIARLLKYIKPLPEGEFRDKLFDEVSCLDSIGDVMTGD